MKTAASTTYLNALGVACTSLVACSLINPVPPLKLPPEGGAAGLGEAAGSAGLESAPAGAAGANGSEIAKGGAGDAATGGAKATGGTTVAGGSAEAGAATGGVPATQGGRAGTAGSALALGGTAGQGGASAPGGAGYGGTATAGAGAAGASSAEAGAAGTAGTGGESSGGAAGSGGGATGGSGTGGVPTGGTGGLGCGPEGPSCEGGLTCDDGGTSCCTSLVVEGGSYDRARNETPSYPATVSSFCLDKYEVTVGRFRKFVEAYNGWRGGGHPALYEGAHPKIGAPSGWDTAWNSELPESESVLKDADHLNSGSSFQTWRDVAQSATAERLPVDFVSWYEAFAFCIWDGGRLPTEAEWQYAAQGGRLYRKYPWGDEAPTSTRAVWNCIGDGSAALECSYADILPVGSKPDGDGLWHQSDLAGSMYEWNLDWSATYREECDNCAELKSADDRVMRGGGWYGDAVDVLAAYRASRAPTGHDYAIGFRCARTPE